MNEMKITMSMTRKIQPHRQKLSIMERAALNQNILTLNLTLKLHNI